MRKNLCIALVFVAMLLVAAPSLDELAPPAADPKAPTQVQNPSAVKVTAVKNSSAGATQRVEAATPQDAVNKARTLNTVVSEIKVGSGIGFVATGTAFYKHYRNRNAQLISQRGAYMDALMKAKAELAKYLYGMNVKAQEELKNSLASFDTAEENKALMNNYRMESVQSSVEAMLRGYVVFSVEDNPQKKKVSVTIATTPRTRAASMTVSAVAIASSDYRSAMQKLLAELSTGTLPPEGAKVFVIPNEKGENQVFCVSFGSSIIRRNDNERLSAALEEQANRVSSLRAARNMIALLNGDKILWETGHTDITKEREMDSGIKELLKKTKNDALAKPLGLNGKEDINESFLNIVMTSDAYKSSTEGKLPPGVQEKKWTDDNGDWAYTLLIYNANMTASTVRNRSTLENLNARPGQNGKGDAGKKAAPTDIKPIDKVETDANTL